MSAALRVAGGMAAAVLAALACAVPAEAGAPPGRDPCARTRTMRPGPTAGAYFATVAPFEHAGSDRTQVFPRSCTLAELTGERRPAIALRSSPQDVATPYDAVTRRRDQLYLYGYGADAATEGGYVASVDPATLRQRWRTRIPDRSPPGQWSYPGVVLAHGNGFLYAVYGNVLVKLDPRTGRTLARRVLPRTPVRPAPPTTAWSSCPTAGSSRRSSSAGRARRPPSRPRRRARSPG